MKLISIKSQGFKSFADKIEISVTDGITGIVGPNGSGKSNIVDAVKWVLGEQSVKTLRGTSSMTDVIFAGSKTRSELSRAWVSLTFDNSDHYLNSDFTTIDIKRVVYRTGENEYYINNSKVRLKDITDLFIDSGSSTNSFSIISQGKISEILSGKPSDRRAIIEEAAGVLKYKKRKEESLKKLDKTNDNLDKLNLVIKELETNLEPLRKQSEDATLYKKYSDDLKNIDIALIVTDVSELNDKYSANKNEIEELTEKINDLDNNNLMDNSKIETMKLEILKIDDEINKLVITINEITEALSKLNARKQIISERKKYEVDDLKLENNIQLLKETELKYRKNIDVLEETIKNLKLEYDKSLEESKSLEQEYKTTVVSKANINEALSNQLKKELSLKNRIDILESNINNNVKIPMAVKSVLNNVRLSGIHDILANIIDTEEKYSKAIEIAIGANANNIIVDDEASAKKAILYLKEKKLGRATFLPISVVKKKKIDDDTYHTLPKIKGYIDVAANLVKCDSIYENIIKSQLGNTIIVDNIDNMNELAKIIKYRYRVITLAGEVIHPGGAITGGERKKDTGIISDKFELESLKIDLRNEEVKTKNYEKDSNEIDYNLKVLENKLYQIKSKNSGTLEVINRKNIDLVDNKTNLENTLNEITGTMNKKSNSIDDELNKLLEDYYALEKDKELKNNVLEKLKSDRNELQAALGEKELENKHIFSKYNELNKILKEKEIELSKVEYKLDDLLLKLNEEYKLTYDIAKNDYELNDTKENSRLLVNDLKRKISSLGDVNLGSISEYQRVNERYTFLSSQRNDLEKSISDLLEVIDDLDSTMKERFSDTFSKVNEEFKKVFKQLFKGGNGYLELTESDDLLNTGVDIIACPPGKNLKSINMMSGGEKTLTAIALLFSILNIRVVPFCILDEVEAALDEANVDMFGNYLKEYKDKTQFIIITHKKRTMEYAKTLYGITMQESGVSKLVSVRLDNI